MEGVSGPPASRGGGSLIYLMGTLEPPLCHVRSKLLAEQCQKRICVVVSRLGGRYCGQLADSQERGVSFLGSSLASNVNEESRANPHFS